MLCAECQQENPAGAKFCGTCGARLAPACSGCGATHRPGQAFCWACGARIPPLTSATTAGSPGNHIPRHLAERILTSKAVARCIVRSALSPRPKAEILPYPALRLLFLLNALFPDLLARLARWNHVRALQNDAGTH